MPPNHSHKTVHSSAMYFQNVNVIHESSKKLLAIKGAKCFNHLFDGRLSSVVCDAATSLKRP